MARGKPMATDVFPRALVNVFAEFDALRSGDDQTLFGTHFLAAAWIEIKAVIDQRHPKFKHIHNREADFAGRDESGTHFLGKIPEGMRRNSINQKAPSFTLERDFTGCGLENPFLDLFEELLRQVVQLARKCGDQLALAA